MPDPVRFNDSMPLSDARATLRTLVDVGHQCPQENRVAIALSDIALGPRVQA
jgi:hypothetical protein